METGQSGPTKFFLATVASVTAADGVSIIPDGQTEPVPKKYKILLTCAVPAAGERVVVMKHSGTCVILGAIGTPNQVDQKVNRSGDTMTGLLNINRTSPGVIAKTTGRASSDTVATNTNSYGFRVVDKNGDVVALYTDRYETTGENGAFIGGYRMVNGTNTGNNLRLLVDAAGNKLVYVTSPGAWRKALGLGTNGAFPITVAQGGTGNTGIVVVDTIANIISAASGFTITQAAFCAWGKIAMIYVRAKATAATSSGWHTVGTVVSGKRPAVMLHASELNFGASSFYITGEIQVYGAMTADQNLYLSATYLLA